MQKLKFVFLLCVFILPLSSAVKIEILDYPETVYTLEKSTVRFKLINDGTQRDTFYIGVWPSSWISLEKYFVTLNAGEEETLRFVVEPPIFAETGNIVFTITAKSTLTDEVVSEDIILNVRRRVGTYISDVVLNQEIVLPKETLFIKSVLVNLDKTRSKHVILRTSIIKDEKQVKVFEDEVLLEASSTKTISTPFEVKNDYEPGLYKVQVYLYDNLGRPIHSKLASFTIKRYSEIDREKKITRSLLETIFTINITNKGNYPQTIIVTETMPKISKYFFYPEKEPNKEEEKENRVVYTWIVEDIKPNESVVIVYSLRFGSAAFVVFLFLLFVTFILSLFHKPLLMKRYSEILDLEDENLVTLHVKNNSLREINNVIVKDIVPPVFVVVKEFDTLKPEVKVTQAGTHLIWKIDKLKPKEDRVLVYKIKPVMHVDGRLKLPKAYFSYKAGKTIISKIVEKIVTFSKRVR
ncbi:MAG: hypothetical protein N3E38_02435 [Candidatus Aenigmarchaeota archaeon]|nr:hypothetical protein [Candidatus Aenigmarchaeota archaeon]